VILFSENSHVRANEFYNNVFADDIDGNGLADFAMPVDDRIQFYEFIISSGAIIPTNIIGYGIDTNKVYLSWFAEATKYYIYRGLDRSNLILYDSTIQNNYYDLSVNNHKTYFYAIKSFDNSKNIKLSAMSKTVEVYVHPKVKVASHSVLNGSSIIIEFSDKISTGITNLNSFTLNSNIFPSSISVKTEKSYILSFSPALAKGDYTLFINNLCDFFRSPIDSQQIAFTVLEQVVTDQFFIENYEILDTKTIKIKFNLPIKLEEFEKLNNYVLNNENEVIGVTTNSDNFYTLVLNVKNPITGIGKTGTIKIQNVFSSAETGNIPINSGAGSFLVLSVNSGTLKDIYVYPNPYIDSESDGKIYFAKLTDKTDIIIFDINGRKVAELSERDGNGGTEWDLTDMSTGNKVESGIYLYRAVALDGGNNEIEVKIGKFAVTR